MRKSTLDTIRILNWRIGQTKSVSWLEKHIWLPSLLLLCFVCLPFGQCCLSRSGVRTTSVDYCLGPVCSDQLYPFKQEAEVCLVHSPRCQKSPRLCQHVAILYTPCGPMPFETTSNDRKECRNALPLHLSASAKFVHPHRYSLH